MILDSYTKSMRGKRHEPIDQFTVEGVMPDARNLQWFSSDRLLPRINYVTQWKWAQSSKPTSLKNGDWYYDSRDGKIKVYYSEQWRPTEKWLSDVRKIRPNNKYYVGDYVREELPVGEYHLYKCIQDVTTPISLWPGSLIDPLFWEEVNYIEWVYPKQLEYASLFIDPGLLFQPFVPTGIVTDVNFWIINSSLVDANYPNWLVNNDGKYILQTDGRFVITVCVVWWQEATGTYRKTYLQVNGSTVARDTEYLQEFEATTTLDLQIDVTGTDSVWWPINATATDNWSTADTTLEAINPQPLENYITYHLRGKAWDIISVQSEQDSDNFLSLDTNLSYLHITRAS